MRMDIVKINLDRLLGDSVVPLDRKGMVSIQFTATRRVRFRLWLATRLVRLAGWCAYGMIEVVAESKAVGADDCDEVRLALRDCVLALGELSPHEDAYWAAHKRGARVLGLPE